MNKTNRIIHFGIRMNRKKHYFISKLIHGLLRLFRQCDISMSADIDDSVYFCHKAFGVIINPNCKIGGGHNYSTLCDFRRIRFQ